MLIVIRAPYNYSPLKVGLFLLSFGQFSYLSVLVTMLTDPLTYYQFIIPGGGNVLGSILGGRYSDYILQRLKRKNGGQGEPEMRLQSALGGESSSPL